MSKTILTMEGITKRFPGVLALDNVSLEVNKGEVHILAGENGAGKSTLMKILSGAYNKDEGKIILENKEIEILSPKHAQDLGVSIIYQELNLIPNLSVAENIFLGRENKFQNIAGKINWKSLYKSAEEILDRLNLDINVKSPINSLSIARQQMVEIAKALSLNSDIIIMDEPTSALSETEIGNLFDNIKLIKEKGVAIIYISHRIEEYNRIGDAVTVMRDGKTIATRRIEETTNDELITLMVGRKLTEKFPKINSQKGEELLRVSKLSCKDKLKDISFELHAGEILGIGGLMGAGRTELANVIFGVDDYDKGSIFIRGEKVKISSPRQAIQKGIAYLTEDRKEQGLVLNMDVDKNITLANINEFINGIHINHKKESLKVKDYIKKLKIKTSRINTMAKNLSGGNQQKVIIAKWLLTKSEIFIFDEPTRGIDVGAKIEVYNLMNELVKKGAGVIMISSELPELLGMSDRIMVICRGEVTAHLDMKEATQEKLLYYATGGEKHIG